MTGTYVPPQVSEAPDQPVEDCAPSADLMAANKASLGAYPADRAERERIRSATGKPHGGLTVVDLNRANLALFGQRLDRRSIPFSRFIVDYMDHDYGAVLLGSAGELPDHYNRWDPAFGRKPNSGHAVYVQGAGPHGRKAGHLWWMNPLAPWSYGGEWIELAAVRAYAWSIGQSGIVQEGAWATANTPEEPMGLTWGPTSQIGTIALVGAGHALLSPDPASYPNIADRPDGQVLPAYGTGRLAAPYNAGPGDRQNVYVTASGGRVYLVLFADARLTAAAPLDCTAAVDQATKVYQDRIRKAQLDLAGP